MGLGSELCSGKGTDEQQAPRTPNSTRLFITLSRAFGGGKITEPARPGRSLSRVNCIGSELSSASVFVVDDVVVVVFPMRTALKSAGSIRHTRNKEPLSLA